MEEEKSGVELSTLRSAEWIKALTRLLIAVDITMYKLSQICSLTCTGETDGAMSSSVLWEICLSLPMLPSKI